MSDAETVRGGRAARMRKGAAANSLALVARILQQLLQVPLFLAFWPADRYGDWLVLWTLPAYLTLGGAGFGAAGGNVLAGLAHENAGAADKARAQTVFKAVWLMITAGTAVIGLAVTLIVAFAASRGAIALETVPSTELVAAVAWFALYVFLRSEASVMETGFRYVKAYPLYTVLDNGALLVEFAALAVALSLGGGVADLAAALCVVRAMVLAFAAIVVRARAGFLFAGWRNGEIGRAMRELATPALGFLLVPAGHALSLQGFVILVSVVFGASATAVFVTLRTMVRFVDTVLSLAFNIMYYEVAYTEKGGERRAFAARLFQATPVFFTLTLGYCTVLWVFGDGLHAVWTQGKVAFDKGLLLIFSLAALVRSLNAAPVAIVSGANLLFRYGLVYVCAAGLALGLAVLVGGATDQIRLVAALIIAVDSALFATALIIALRHTGMGFAEYARHAGGFSAFVLARREVMRRAERFGKR